MWRGRASSPPAHYFQRATPAGALAPAGQLTAASAAAGLRPANRQSENSRYKRLKIKCPVYLGFSDRLTREARGGQRDLQLRIFVSSRFAVGSSQLDTQMLLLQGCSRA